MEKSGLTYNMQELFNVEGNVSIQVIALGENLCLLEDMVEGELKDLVLDGKEWLSSWFREVCP